MARRRRDADTPDIASSELLRLPQAVSPISYFTDVDQLTEIEDRRRFHPEAPYQAPLSFSGLPATIGERYAQRNKTVSYNLERVLQGPGTYPAFDRASHAIVCARRKARREVILAKRHHRRRRRGGNGGRRNYWSEVKC